MEADAGTHIPPGGVKRLRKGTRSCTECRQRKIRCEWNSPHDTVCTSCTQRGRKCQPQLYRRTTSAQKLSSKDRIGRLEAQLASITASVHDNGRNRRPASSGMSSHHDESPHEEDEDSLADEPSFVTEGPAEEPAIHMQLLFDHAGFGKRDEGNELELGSARVSKRYLDHARAKLQRLLPTREDVKFVADFATPWMSVYLSLFPSTSPITNKDDLLSNYNETLEDDAHPISIAMFLLIFSVTVLQTPQDGQVFPSNRWKDGLAFTHEVVHNVETTVVSHQGLAITVEGIETTVMYMRVKLSLGNVRTLWLTLRRTIALAELVGLPRAWYLRDKVSQSMASTPSSTSSSRRDRLTQKAALWETICATDRLASLMFNLPAATSMHKFPSQQVMSANGEASPRAYVFELASIACVVQELDEAYALGQPHAEVFEKVLSIDRRVRTLKNSTPKDWWNGNVPISSTLSATDLAQFWHFYLTARIHLPSALQYDTDEYAYSRMRCTEACEKTCQRYCHVRPLLPAGFFLCRIVDMQVFTAAVFLVLTCIKHTQRGEGSTTTDQRQLTMVESVAAMMDQSADLVAGGFIKEATGALKSLIALFYNPASAGSQNLALRIPLLGKVRIGRGENRQKPEKNQIWASAESEMYMQMPMAGMEYQQQPVSTATLDPNIASTFPWLMQLDLNSSSLQDPLFFGDNLTEFDVWTGMGNMPGAEAMDYGSMQ